MKINGFKGTMVLIVLITHHIYHFYYGLLLQLVIFNLLGLMAVLLWFNIQSTYDKEITMDVKDEDS